MTLFNARHLGAVQISIHHQIAQLSLLCVRDVTRRRGVGKNLLHEIEKQLQVKGVNEIQLLLAQTQQHEIEGLEKFMCSCGYQLKQNIFSKNI